MLIRERGARLLCPNRAPHDASCTGCFSEQSIARFLSAELHAAHMENQRSLIHAEEFSKFNNMLNEIVKRLKCDMPGLSRDLLERQLQEMLPNARQCGSCGCGPIEHHACRDLKAHHGEWKGRARINNACPKCGWFSADIDSWPKWNGRVSEAVAAPVSLMAPMTLGSRAASSNGNDALQDLRAAHIRAQIRDDHELAVRLSRQWAP